MYLYIYVTTQFKENTMNLKKNKEEHLGGFEKRNVKGEIK